MLNPVRRGPWRILPMILILLACATSPQGPSLTDQRGEIKRLILQVQRNPRSAEAFRDLGAALYEMQWYKFAVKSLIQAYRLNTRDAKTLYYLARLLEEREQTDRATQIYGRYDLAKSPPEYSHKMQAQYNLISRTKSRGEIQRLLQSEALLQIKTTSPQSVAVLPLKYMGLDDQYEAMGKGVAEMIMTDLSQISSLNVVERVRVQALYDEMSLDQTGLMKTASTPKLGKLLGAGKVIQGDFAVLNDRDIHLDVTYNDIVSNRIPDAVTLKDNLKQLFALEKDLVFQVIEQMGLNITPEERQRIQRIPTQNIQAFMAYSMGLEMEDQGNFTKASEYFSQAAQLDPGYQEAQNKMAVNQSMAQISTITPQNRRRNTGVSPKVPLEMNLVSRETLINDRLQNVNRNIGGLFIPGQESRKSTQEFSTVQILSEALGEQIDLSGIRDFDAEALFNTMTLPDLPTPPPPPGQ